MIGDSYLSAGKLELEFLKQLLETYHCTDESVVVGPGIGNDAAVIDIGDSYLIAKSDPITFVSQDIGFYAVNINANDIACMGGVPRWFLVTILLPEKYTTQSQVKDIFQQISAACTQLKIALCGGHTEVTHGISRPIIAGQMLGTASKERLIQPKNVQIGDDVLLTKGIAIEATSIVAREKSIELIDLFSSEFVERCQNFIKKPGISVLNDAQIALQSGAVHAMHDPTEGGLAMGLYELANAANAGITIELDKIPMLAEAKLLCDQYGLDILGVIASGALLIIAPHHAAQVIINELGKNRIPAASIGKITSKRPGVTLKMGKEEMEMPIFQKDEIIKIF
ncbi:AIR synthase family protein [candidate division KSB1 bacterium]|nr:AIR synthase family protein [candidate division KSB1 bacterium]